MTFRSKRAGSARMARPGVRRAPGLAVLALVILAGAALAETIKAPDRFLAEAFAGEPPPASVLWLTEDVRAGARSILGHDYPGLRLRYWRREAKTAWILEEIGKELPITTGIVVEDGRIDRVEVLVYRESRGWEVRYPFFTDQFQGLSLARDSRLSEPIDGISGATLSVAAIEKLARLALTLDALVIGKDGQI